MSTEQWRDQIIYALEEKQANHIQWIDVQKIFPLADYFVVASAGTDRHLWTLCEVIRKLCKENHIVCVVQGVQEKSQWIVIDAKGIFIHLFQSETRDDYRLEELWQSNEA